LSEREYMDHTAAESNKTIYDENWRAWEAMKRFGPMSRHSQRMAMEELKKLEFSSVLDIGCGPGVFLSVVRDHFPGVSLAGTDISDAAVNLAKKNIPSGKFWRLDVTKDCVPETFDIVTMIDVAEHIDDDCAAFANIRTICARYLLIMTLEGRMRDFEADVGHVRNYKRDELPQKLEKAGFTIRTYKHWGFPMFSPLYRDASQSIDAIHKPMTPLRRFLGMLAYWALSCNVPDKGDLIIVLASPNDKENGNV
jgi:2-polyprenyl-3-methyl-5-hydroxy-6-metoxy-1,4-benzoquinol methylase